METRFNVSSSSNTSNGGQQQFPASTFPETFKDFFSMINEDEDHIELVSNVLEDKVSLALLATFLLVFYNQN